MMLDRVPALNIQSGIGGVMVLSVVAGSSARSLRLLRLLWSSRGRLKSPLARIPSGLGLEGAVLLRI